ncbi:tetratricopeptide repeat protein [Rubellicoccus peritrichatus]|uniref:Tetratricopeptide repeat protein n=1 Tax=Rubellicoccus peritrichatus TaxID=3080537 RepID=A0AAQ3LA08_9BACT|nr:tetratricopeptide repeat protein [Puniceicoccus sp. CR14]WOO42050.1 tetratricopeptide repeat protein [Puniceicoccus sp. CR14]
MSEAIDIVNLRFLNQSSRYLDAYDLIQAEKPVQQWEDGPLKIEAAETLRQIGSPRLADSIVLRAYRNSTDNLTFRIAAVSPVARHRGLWGAWQLIRSVPEGTVDSDSLARLHQKRAQILTSLRDFELTEIAITSAHAAGISKEKELLLKADLLKGQDRADEAHELLVEAAKLVPNSAIAGVRLAESYYERREIERTLKLYDELNQNTQARYITYRYIRILIEQEEYVKAAGQLDALKALGPLSENRVIENTAEIEAEIHFHQGRRNEAVEAARKSSRLFFKIWSENVAKSDDDSPRKVLDVPFIKQDHLTCVPASISALSIFFDHPIDQKTITDALTYDGTPDSTERKWLEDHGWRVREFAVTWEITRTLIDNNLPFALTTRDLYSSHMQAVIGYDAAQGIYYIREPGSPLKFEWLARESEERYKTNGLRGILILPPGMEDPVRDVSLPEEGSYDLLFQFHQALLKHDVNQAVELADALKTLNESPRLCCLARIRLAQYNEDLVAQIEAIDDLLAIAPNDPYYIHQKAWCLRSLGRQEESHGLLRSILQDDDEVNSLPFHLRLMLAESIASDHRYRGETWRLLRRIQTMSSYNSQAYWILGNLLTDMEDFNGAEEATRFASTISYYDEYYAEAYFNKSRRNGNHTHCLEYLVKRVDKLGDKSGKPWVTLADAYACLNKHETMLETIRKGMELNPNDENLLTYSIRALYNNGEMESAFSLLKTSRDVLKSKIWKAEQANLEAAEGHLDKALLLWKEVLGQTSGDRNAISSIAHLTECLTDIEQKQAFLKEQVAEHPRNFSILVDYLISLRHDPEAHWSGLMEARKLFPDRPWIEREAALCAKSRNDFITACELLEHLKKIEPRNAFNLQVAGDIAVMEKDLDKARKLYREAICLDIDSEDSIHGLLDACASMEERIEACRFISDEIQRQVNYGAGISAFGKQIVQVLPLSDALSLMESLVEARPDLWQAWDAVIELYLGINQPAKALEYANRAFERFPYVGPISYRLSSCYETLHQNDKGLAMLQLTVERNPGYGFAIRELSEKLRNTQQKEKAYDLLKRQIRKEPLNETNYGFIGNFYARDGRLQESIDNLKYAVSINPAYGWARERLLHAAKRCMNKEEIIDWVRSLIEKKSWNEHAHICLINFLYDLEGNESALDACNEALERFPTCFDLIDWKAFLLDKIERYEEAIAATEVSGLPYGHAMTLSIRHGLIERNRGNALEAIRLFKQCAEEDPNEYRAWQNLAELYKKQQDFKEEIRSAEEMIRINPLSDDSYWYCADGYRQQRIFDQARSTLYSILEIRIDSEDNILLLLDCCETQEEYKNAFDFLRREIIQQVNYGSAILTFAELAPRIIESDDLLEQLRKIKEARPDLWQSWAALILELKRQALYDELALLISEALELHGHIPRMYQIAAEYYESQGMLDEAIEALREAIKLAPEYYYASRMLVDCLLNRNDLEEATQLARTLVEKQSDVAMNHGYLAIALFRNNDDEQAIDSLFKAIKIDPLYHWARNQLIGEFQKRDRYRELIEFFITESQEDPPSADKYLNLAVIFGRVQLWSDALTAINKTLELAPDSVDARDLKGYYLTELGHYEEALKCCDYEEGNFQEKTQLAMRRGLIEKHSGDWERAARSFKEILKLDALNIVAAKNLTECYEKSKKREYYKAATTWTELEPENAVAFGHLGAACDSIHLPDEAKRAFKRAHQLDPTYLYGTIQYFDNCLKAKDEAAALEVIERLKQVGGSTDYAYYEVSLYCHRKEQEQAWAAFEVLISDPYCSCMDSAFDKLKKSFGKKWFEKKSRVCLQQEQQLPNSLGRFWALCSMEKAGVLRTLYRARKFPPQNITTVYTHIQLLETCGEKQRRYMIRLALYLNRDYYYENKVLYGAVTYALSSVRMYGATVKWASGWAERQDLELWFLLNIGLAMAIKRRFADLYELLDRCYQVIPDHTYDRLIVYVCLFEPRTEIVMRYASQLKRVDTDAIGGILRQYKDLAEMRTLANGLDGTEPDPKGARRLWWVYFRSICFNINEPGYGRRAALFLARKHTINDRKYISQINAE